MINPVTRLFMAKRMGVPILSENVDHTPLVSAPEPVIGMILHAAKGRAMRTLEVARRAA